MLTIDIGYTSKELIDWQAVAHALLKGEKISVKQAGTEIGEFLPKKSQNQTAKPKRKLGFMQGEGVIPDDIHWGDDEIQAMFDQSITADKELY